MCTLQGCLMVFIFTVTGENVNKVPFAQALLEKLRKKLNAYSIIAKKI
jgi:hypothetical protein